MLDLHFIQHRIKYKNQYLPTIKDQECHKADFWSYMAFCYNKSQINYLISSYT